MIKVFTGCLYLYKDMEESEHLRVQLKVANKEVYFKAYRGLFKGAASRVFLLLRAVLLSILLIIIIIGKLMRIRA